MPVWHPGLPKDEVRQLERVQKCAFYVILGESYLTYQHALDTLGCASLFNRRQKLCETFTQKAGKHPKYKNWFNEFKPKNPKMSTRESEKCLKYKPVPCRTNRYKNSPLPFLTELLDK